MAAAGGDTVVPTKWSGLISVVLLIAIIATATYFGMHFTFDGDEDKSTGEKSLSIQDVFSASSERQIAAAEPARALSRADFAPSSSDPADDSGGDAADDWDDSADDWDSPGDASADWDKADDGSADMAMHSDASADDWADDTAAKDSWDAAADDSRDEGMAGDDQASSDPGPMPAEANTSTSTSADTQQASSDSSDSPPRAEALYDWWNDSPGELSVNFIGPMESGQAIAIMFSATVDPSAANEHIRLHGPDGQAVSGQWQSGQNARLIFFDGLNQDRYRLKLGSGLTATNGDQLGQDIEGPALLF